MPWGGEKGYSIIQKDWTFMKGIMRRNKVKKVVEFGSGLSTFLFSELADEVISYEDDPTWIKNFKEHGIKALKNGYENVAKIKVFKWDGHEIKQKYNGKFDLAFVDGPRGKSAGGKIGRRNSIQLATQLADRILVHDAGRTDELVWQLEYLRPDFHMAGMSGYHQGRCQYWIRKSLLEKQV